jgi:hypothetical protein
MSIAAFTSLLPSHTLEQSRQREEKLRQKLMERTSNKHPELAGFLAHQTHQQIQHPLTSCSNAWSAAQKRYRLQRLDTVGGVYWNNNTGANK